MHIYASDLYEYMCIYMHTYVINRYHLTICMKVCACVYTCVRACTHTCIYAYTHACIHAYTHTHTNTHKHTTYTVLSYELFLHHTCGGRGELHVQQELRGKIHRSLYLDTCMCGLCMRVGACSSNICMRVGACNSNIYMRVGACSSNICMRVSVCSF